MNVDRHGHRAVTENFLTHVGVDNLRTQAAGFALTHSVDHFLTLHVGGFFHAEDLGAGAAANATADKAINASFISILLEVVRTGRAAASRSGRGSG